MARYIARLRAREKDDRIGDFLRRPEALQGDQPQVHLARVRGEALFALQHSIEHGAGGAVGAVEIQRFTEADDVHGAFARREATRTQAAKAFTGVGEIVGRAAEAKAFEIGARRYEIGGVRL